MYLVSSYESPKNRYPILLGMANNSNFTTKYQTSYTECVGGFYPEAE